MVIRYFKKYMPVPEFAAVFNKIVTDNILYSNPIFIDSYVKTSAFSRKIKIDNLTAGFGYSLICYAQNLNRIPSENYKRLDFSMKCMVISAPKNSYFYA